MLVFLIDFRFKYFSFAKYIYKKGAVVLINNFWLFYVVFFFEIVFKKRETFDH